MQTQPKEESVKYSVWALVILAISLTAVACDTDPANNLSDSTVNDVNEFHDVIADSTVTDAGADNGTDTAVEDSTVADAAEDTFDDDAGSDTAVEDSTVADVGTDCPDGSTFTWGNNSVMFPGPLGLGGFFGKRMSISDTFLLGGASYENDGSGSVYVYRSVGSDWVFEDKLTTDEGEEGGAYDGFGGAIAQSGDLMIVGAPSDGGVGRWYGSAYAFELKGGTWVQKAILEPSNPGSQANFGHAVAINGKDIFVGGFGDTVSGVATGSVRVFERQGDNSYVETATLVPSDPTSHKEFGISIATVGDILLIGATNHHTTGSVYIFRRDKGSGEWVEELKVTDPHSIAQGQFGNALAYDGQTAIVGANAYKYDDSRIGAAYVMSWDETGLLKPLVQLTASDAIDHTYFGTSVAVSGETIIVGATSNGVLPGATYVFERDIDGTWLQTHAFSSPTANPEDSAFGSDVAILNDVIYVGEPQVNNRDGMIHMYRKDACVTK